MTLATSTGSPTNPESFVLNTRHKPALAYFRFFTRPVADGSNWTQDYRKSAESAAILSGAPAMKTVVTRRYHLSATWADDLTLVPAGGAVSFTAVGLVDIRHFAITTHFGISGQLAVAEVRPETENELEVELTDVVRVNALAVHGKAAVRQPNNACLRNTRREVFSPWTDFRVPPPLGWWRSPDQLSRGHRLAVAVARRRRVLPDRLIEDPRAPSRSG